MSVYKSLPLFFGLCLLFTVIPVSYAEIQIKVDESPINRSYSGVVQSFAPILSSSTPAVVSVTTQQIVRRIFPGSRNQSKNFLEDIMVILI